MRKMASFSTTTCLLALLGAACSGNDTSSGPPNTSSAGGDASTGGTIAGNGGAPVSSGGTASAAGGSTGGKAAGGTTNSSGTGGKAVGGGTTTTVATGGASTGGTTNTVGNGTGGNSAGGSPTTGGTTSNSATGGKAAGGSSSTGGTATSSSGTGGKATGGSTSSSGTGGKATGGATATGGVAATGGLASGTGGGTGVSVSSSCPKITWPTAKGTTVTISGTKSVTNYDGLGALHEGNLNDCTKGDQNSTTPIIEVADGGSVKNVIFGRNIGDGIHCLGNCTIDNVWFPYICDDAITINKDGASSGTSTISNSGFKGARDKTIQHNGGNGTLNITNVYSEVAGKLYRSCGSGGGCTTSAKHTVNISNVVAIGVNQVAGVSENDMVTLSNICTFRTAVLCNTYQVNSDTDSTKGANGTGEGPSPNCSYKASDTHALVDRVVPGLTTDILCTGSNSAKSGSTATACVTGFENCLKVCAPGMNGFKQLSCSGGTYASAATGACNLVNSATDSAATAALASTNAASATSNVTKNASCSTQWAWGKDSSNTANYCVCTEKPGYYQASTGSAQPATWMVWDCQSQWW